ncbi:MAG: DNA polymerase I [Oscillospiraceae bacterium]
MKLMVLDGNSIVNRAYYGIRPLTTRDGLYTHAVYGFLTTLARLTEEETPDAVCVTFDLHAPTFRHLAYDGYKAQRKGMPEELRMQMPVLKEVLDAMNIPRYELEGFEADDLIGTISRKCEAAGWDCVVVTGDKDSLQLITDHTKVKLVSTRMGQTTTKDMTPAVFQEEYGFAPPLLVDLKALMGDTSDNIPGVPGVGEKTAMALVQKYGTIDNLYAKLPDIEAKPAALKKLTAGEDSARQSHYLATIITDVPLDFAPEDNLRKAPSPALYDLFLKLEFSKLIDKMGLVSDGTAPTQEKVTVTCNIETVESDDRVRELLALWRKRDHVSFVALPSLDGVAVEWGEGDEGRCAIFHRSRLTDYAAFLRGFFAPDIPKVSHNSKDTMRCLLDEGLTAEGFVFDTALAAYLLDATAGSYDLPRLAVSYFNFELPPEKEFTDPEAFSLLGNATEAITVWVRHVATVEALYEALPPLLREQNLWTLYETVELPLCPVLAEMEHTGFRADAGELRRFGEELNGKMQTLEAEIYALAGETFNINSPKQLGVILFEKLNLPPDKKTKSGYSTGVDVLEKLRTQHPIVDAVLQYRQYAKLKSTYADGLLKVLGADGRIHTGFQMTVTATGRLSSTEPNLQNIPTRTELGSELRRMFVPDPGLVLVDADYSQIELRLLAHIADDKAMQDAFLSGTDIHTVTASQVFHVPLDEVTHTMRSSAKAVNFGIVYGISPFSLAQDIGVSNWEAKEYIDSYFETYAGVKRYMTEIVERAKQDGYVETLYHRRRALPELKASNFNMRSFGERVALNMPIQGTAADIMKLAMVAVWRRLRAEGLQARLILQVHDELIVECPPEEAPLVEQLLTEEMAGVASLKVPLTAEAHTGDNWLSAKG